MKYDLDAERHEKGEKKRREKNKEKEARKRNQRERPMTKKQSRWKRLMKKTRINKNNGKMLMNVVLFPNLIPCCASFLGSPPQEQQ